MSTSLTVFKFNTAEVRTVTDERGEPWFVAIDACHVLDLEQVTRAIAGLDDDEKGVTTIKTLGGEQFVNIISESGLYSLVLRSRKPEAKAFKRWITHEVLPAIRKTGRFAIQMTHAQALRAYADEVEAREKLVIENAEMKPKAEFYDHVTASADTLAMRETAKLIGVGPHKMMARLRELKILRANNTPYQEYLDRGYFKVVESKWTKDGESHVTLSTRAFQSGIDYLRKKLTAGEQEAA